MKIFNTFFIGCVLSLNLSNSQAEPLEPVMSEAQKPAETMNALDPYENYNRAVFDFNMKFHNAIGEPVTMAYLDYVPSPAQTGIKNFFSNLTTPLDALNSFLQGKGEEGLSGIMRFAINSTFGLGGLLDIATPAGLPKKEEDFGQTLYVWGVWDEASFLMIPFFGPYTTRSFIGDFADNGVDPIYTMTDTDMNRTAIYFGDVFIKYTVITPLIDEVRQQPDPYIFMRESYLQYRTNLIYDGNPPQADLDDFDFE
ncbi:MAG TPA: VacJ family lipoprotein [Thiomicrospira sp.]|nr:VacJ family lipoprotein [Thiomicrospira sp.]